MMPHQERVVTERNELKIKLDGLLKFYKTPLFVQLDPDEQGRLHKQGLLMAEYLSVLEERIAALGKS